MFLSRSDQTEWFASLFCKDADGNYFYPKFPSDRRLPVSYAEMEAAMETFEGLHRRAMAVVWTLLIASVVMFCFRAGTVTLQAPDLLAFPATWLVQICLMRWVVVSSLEPFTRNFESRAIVGAGPSWTDDPDDDYHLGPALIEINANRGGCVLLWALLLLACYGLYRAIF